MDKTLSILIPSRCEMFLSKTIENLLENIEGDTNIIAVLDGALADPGIAIHPKVTVVYLPESIGQRAATNLACKLSSAKYVMKLDAHCSVGKGFDRILMEDMQDDITMIPMMYNLHAFDWVCEDGHRRYQGPSGECKDCGKSTTRDILWKAKPSPETTAMRFDSNLKFQYWSGYKKYQKGDLVETMSILGACWMLTRDKYWELNICDEGHGSWGQQGTEVSCKTWLSGGRVLVNKRTWFSHMFRTQGGDFGFPYPLPRGVVEKAREYSKNLWKGNNWNKAVHNLDWLIKKFAPVPDWSNPKKEVIYYSDNQLDKKLFNQVQRQITKGIKEKHIISVTLEPTKFGTNYPLDLERGYESMFKQILKGLEESTADTIFLCEHDVLYHPSHFDFTPPKKDIFYYNTNIWKTDGEKAFRVDDCRQVSGLVASRELLLAHYKKRISMIESGGFSRKMGFEPGTHNRAERVDDFKSETYESEYSNIDIRHGDNLTNTRWSKEEFRNQSYTQGWRESVTIEGWGKIQDIIQS